MIKNKGTGAGGSKTTKHGLSFEEQTNYEKYLSTVTEKTDNKSKKIIIDKTKYGYYITNNKFIFTKQIGLKKYLEKTYNIKINKFRNPDESFIIENKLIILEKKNQNVSGSVDLKLYAGIGLQIEYQNRLNTLKIPLTVSYCFCLSNYFKNKKYEETFEILKTQNINIFFGEDKTYFSQVTNWINSK